MGIRVGQRRGILSRELCLLRCIGCTGRRLLFWDFWVACNIINVGRGDDAKMTYIKVVV